MARAKPDAVESLYDVRPITRGVHQAPKAEASIATGLKAREALRVAIKATRRNAGGDDYYGKADAYAIVPTGTAAWDFWSAVRAQCKVSFGRTDAARSRAHALAHERRWAARGALPVRCEYMSDSFKAIAVKSGRKPRRKTRR